MTMPIMLFAAGKGTRMGSLTNSCPKPMIKVAGKPLIDHALQIANAAKVGPKVVNLHYLPELLKTHLSDDDIVFSEETDALLETGGGLRKALPLLGQSPVMTMNTDAVWKGPNPIDVIQNAWAPQMEALLLLIEKKNVSGHLGAGDFGTDAEGRLHRAPDMIYTGVQIIRTDVLSEIDQDAFSMNIAWDIIAKRGGLYGAIYGGKWCDVGQPSSIPLAEAMLHV
ncbi:nucleotidyltransferase family protein [Yoonia sp.]|nr:nucleotidyltransferase family protein [Yoonia sp.]